ncbi:hypothetical protein C8T65DRAFT_787310 [Cerioporus squamosus]|nr:hypothetical protein C8T65DRAFT_787310 [Cerioporus squamosus]
MSSEPSQTTVGDIAKLEVRQHMLEDGTIIDIPAAVLYSPPPKPTEFLYLKHYYQTPSGVKQELKEAGSPEAAIDILAAELEGMRHLLTGYVQTWEKYIEKFDGEHEAVRKDIASIVESYNGLRKIVKAVSEKAPLVDAAFCAMEEKVRTVYMHMHAQTRPPPKIVYREGGNGPKNPEMTPEEMLEFYGRYADQKMSSDNSSWVANTQDMLKQRELLADLTTPPSRPQSGRKGKGKAKNAQPPTDHATPLDPRVEVKIEKLAEGLEAMREAFQRVHAKTEQDLVHLRMLSQKEKTANEEIWAAHNYVEHDAFAVGKINNRSLPRIQAYDRWATKCLEDQAAESSESTDAPSAATAPSLASSDVSSKESATTQGPTTDSEVYTVSLNLKYEKDLDKLTRDEAIEMLKALPLRIQFTPFGSAEGVAAVNRAVPRGKRQGASNVADDSASGEGQPPVVKKSKAAAGAESRKRSRDSEDAGEKQVDSRVAAGGSPVKKLRVQKD